MGLFRDIESINYPGGSSSIPGCREVSLECSGDEIEHSACNDLAIAYRGLTGLTCTADATIMGGFTLIRDVLGVSLGGVTISNVTSVALTMTASELSDSSDADSWLTYVGITSRSIEATITTRCVDALKSSVTGLQLGCIGDFTVKAKQGAIAGCPTGGTNQSASDVTFSATKLMVTSQQVTGTHGDFAEAVITAKGTDKSDTITGASIPMGSKPGKTDVFRFKVLDATGIAETTTTSGVAFTLSRAVLMENSITLTHGEMLEQSFSVKAFSDTGQTSPLSVV